MRTMLQEMIRQLPNRTQMADILVDISQEALATGIQTDRFEPQAEIAKDFYAEKPIMLRMVGTYHQFGEFVSGVASLPRVVILTMHDIALTPVASGSTAGGSNLPPGTLVLQGTVKTYRYIEPAEASGATR
jgi:type IV pilus assembly protein PilO